MGDLCMRAPANTATHSAGGKCHSHHTQAVIVGYMMDKTPANRATHTARGKSHRHLTLSLSGI